MKKLKLYIETSVWNFLFAADAPEKRAATISFFGNIEIVRQKTRAMVNALNRLCGYHELDICTPEEVVDYGVPE